MAPFVEEIVADSTVRSLMGQSGEKWMNPLGLM
jgi:hypothetical protein